MLGGAALAVSEKGKDAPSLLSNGQARLRLLDRRGEDRMQSHGERPVLVQVFLPAVAEPA